MFRYVILAWDRRHPSQQAAAEFLLTRIRAIERWNEHIPDLGLHIFFTGEQHGYTCRPLAAGGGAILGVLFARGLGERHRPAENQLGPGESEQIVASGGRTLIDEYWGNYVALIADNRAGTRYVLKDPSGTLPCHWSELSDVRVFFGSLADFAKLRVVPLRTSETYLRARTGLPDRGRYVQSLQGIHSMHGGEQLTLRDDQTGRRFLWNPLTLASGAEPLDFGQAAAHIRAEAAGATHAWASLHPRILHRLSGGLDSSIVLTCLRSAPSRPLVTGLTYFIPEGISDARPWARLSAGEDVRLIEFARSPHLDLACADRLSPAVLPVSLFDYVETREPELSLARQVQATAIFNGEGGDSLFCRGAARHAVGDLLRSRGLDPKLIPAARDAAILADTTVWHVLGRALRAFFAGCDVADERVLQTKRLLASADVCKGIDAEFESEHLWFREARRPSLSTTLRLGSLLAFRAHYDPLGDDDVPHAISPLLSQPVIEACLQIPIYVHIQGGTDRALARQAFAHDLHPAVLARTWKDRAQGFLEQVLVANRPHIREVLLDGQLIRDGLLDRTQVERELSESPAKRSGFLSEIFDHFDTELWLASLARANTSLH